MGSSEENAQQVKNVAVVITFALAVTGLSLALANSGNKPQDPKADAAKTEAPKQQVATTSATGAPAANSAQKAPAEIAPNLPASKSPIETASVQSPAPSGGVQKVTGTAPLKASDRTPAAPAKTTQFVPEGPNLPTLVTVDAPGGSVAPIQRVDFIVATPFKTPTREDHKTTVAAIPVNFDERNYVAAETKFWAGLPATPKVTEAQASTPLQVAIVWPKFAGWTYRGKLVVYSAGQKPVEVDNVEVDILRTLPK